MVQPAGSQIIGALTPRAVETRILTAIRTLDALSDPDRRFTQPRLTAWPDLTPDAESLVDDRAAAAQRARLAAIRPTPEDIDAMLPTLSWIGDTEKPLLWLLRARAYHRSYRQIAAKRGRSGEHWRRMFRELIGRLTARANGVTAEAA